MNEKIKTIMTILLVVLLGLSCLYYIAKLTAFNEAVINPCGVCEELNPHLKQCFKDSSEVVIDSTTGKPLQDNNLYKINFTTPQ